ncbi:unnamed protein product [Blepharisma stoltei]|uniref:Uncharacterized protein n=1 Tax=Blepharisma stoltei TaxID=1481888 RepID=A0AAU9JSY4_9CILI|nr:unnamed protein product [Blepharisma stoltei]
MKKIEHKRAYSDIPIKDILFQSLPCKKPAKISDLIQQKKSNFNRKLQYIPKNSFKHLPALPNQHIRSVSLGALKLQPYLINLEGKEVIKAPKIFSNQIFTDCYDKEGHHDRIIDNSGLIEVYEVKFPSKNFPNWKNREKDFCKYQDVKPPENSACSNTESTKNVIQRPNMNSDEESSRLASEKSTNIYDLIRPLSLERKRTQKRFF